MKIKKFNENKTQPELKIISEFELVNNYPEYREQFGVDEDDLENEEIAELFNNDPDFAMLDGEKYPYITFEDKNITFVVVPNGLMDDLNVPSEYIPGKNIDDLFEQMLKDFYLNDQRQPEGFSFGHFRGWDEFQSYLYGIAYRGGSGYAYGIYQYLNIFPETTKDDFLEFIIDKELIEDFLYWWEKNK